MKQKHILLLLAIILIFKTNSFSQIEKSKMVKDDTEKESGFYKTVQDFYDNKLTPAGEYVKINYDEVIFKENGKEIKYKLKEISYWGFRDPLGIIHRFYNKNSYSILVYGKIVVYAGLWWDGKNFVYDKYDVSFSQGYEGEIYDLLGTYFKSSKINERITGWMREDDPELADKLEKSKSTLSSVLIDYIQQYNERRLKDAKK